MSNKGLKQERHLAKASTYFKYKELNQLARKIGRNRELKGFEAASVANIDQKLLMIVGEVVEAQEELRGGHEIGETYYNPERPDKPEGFGFELADALIRVLETMDGLGMDIAELVSVKMNYNATREEKHGKRF